MNRPEVLQHWFYMVMKELSRNSYWDMLENWGFSEEEADEVHKYIEEKLSVKL